MSRYVFKLPDMGEGTTQAELVGWHVKVGDVVDEDQHIVDVMTEKATVEIPSPVSGKVVAMSGEPGQILAVGSEILVFETEMDGNPTYAEPPVGPGAPPIAHPASASTKAVSPPAGSPAASAVGSKASSGTANRNGPGFVTRTEGERPIASPAVRQKALEIGVKLQFVPGTGPGGRITHDDLDSYVAPGGHEQTQATAAKAKKRGVEDIKIIGLRRVIAERMQEAKRRIPHFSYIEEIDVTALNEVRGQLNEKWGAERGKLTLLPFLIAAIVKAVADFPQVNARFDDENGVVSRHNAVHMGLATQTPLGLVVPVIKHSETLTLWESAAQIARLANAARENRSSRDELAGSTITITSLGSLGGLATTPVINFPEVAIVGVNKVVERPMVLNGKIVIRKMMNLSSSFDHRVIDGVIAAEFVQSIRALLEQPALLILD